MIDSSKVQEYRKSWLDTGRIYSSLNNDDSETVLKAVNYEVKRYDLMSLPVTSATGNDLVYYEQSLYNSDTDALKERMNEDIKIDEVWQVKYNPVFEYWQTFCDGSLEEEFKSPVEAIEYCIKGSLIKNERAHVFSYNNFLNHKLNESHSKKALSTWYNGIVELLKKYGAVEGVGKYKHSYPFTIALSDGNNYNITVRPDKYLVFGLFDNPYKFDRYGKDKNYEVLGSPISGKHNFFAKSTDPIEAVSEYERFLNDVFETIKQMSLSKK